MVEFTLHAGLHKTATTSLQEHVFPNVKNAFYTGKSRHVLAASSRLTAKNTRDMYDKIVRILQEEGPKPQRLPLHSCCYQLALLQDFLVSAISRHYAPVEQLQQLFDRSELLLKVIESKSENPHIFYSCEGLLLTRGHLRPDEPGLAHHLPALMHHRLLFPGKLKRVVIYVRSPIDYLFSRYIQIHTVRVERLAKHLDNPLISIKKYLKLNEKIWLSDAPHQSVFYHIFQPQLISDLQAIELPIVVRSYDKHIRGNESISKEVTKAFDLQVCDSARVDKAFRDKPLNTTSKDKDSALDQLLRASGHKDRAGLQRQFAEIAAAHPLIQKAMETTVFPAH